MLDVEARLERLERENRAWKIAALALLLAAVIAWQARPLEAASGIQAPLDVQSQAFVLKDGAGRVRAKLAVDRGQDAPILYFFDTAGHGRLVLGLTRDGRPRMALNDAVGQPHVSLTLEDFNEPSMLFYTKDTIYKVPR